MKTITGAAAALVLGLGSISAQGALIEVWQSGSALWSLADADALIASGAADFVDDYSGPIDFEDNGDGSRGFSPLNLPWPGNVNTDFAARITGSFDVASDILASIFVNHDDGIRLTVNGAVIATADGVVDNRTSGGNVALSAGANLVEIVFFERAGGASLELWAGPAGQFNLHTHRLVGLRTVPAPAPLLLLGLGLVGIGLGRRRAR